MKPGARTEDTPLDPDVIDAESEGDSSLRLFMYREAVVLLRERALEEAAVVCDRRAHAHRLGSEAFLEASKCSSAIRCLLPQPRRTHLGKVVGAEVVVGAGPADDGMHVTVFVPGLRSVSMGTPGMLTLLDEKSVASPDCGDNSCLYRDRTKPGGMRTNGGCRCDECPACGRAIRPLGASNQPLRRRHSMWCSQPDWIPPHHRQETP